MKENLSGCFFLNTVYILYHVHVRNISRSCEVTLLLIHKQVLTSQKVPVTFIMDGQLEINRNS